MDPDISLPPTRRLFLALLRTHSLSPTSLARALKDSGKTEVNLQPHFSKWLNDPNLVPAIDTLRPAATYLGVSTVDVFYSDAEAMRELERMKPPPGPNIVSHRVATERRAAPAGVDPWPFGRDLYRRFTHLEPEQRADLQRVVKFHIEEFEKKLRPPRKRKAS